MPTLARRRLAAAGEGLDQGRLAGSVGPTRTTCSPRSTSQGPRPRAGSGPAPRVARPPVFSTKRPVRSGGREGEAQGRACRGGRGRPRPRLILLDLLDPRLRLLGLRRLVAEALDEPLHPLDLRLLALDRLAERDLARRLLGPPGVPGTGEEAAAPRLELEHRGADRLEEPAVVGDEDDGGVEVDQVALEPLERGDVEVVGRLVEQQQLRPGGERRGPARRGSARRRRRSSQRALRLLGGRSRGRRARRAPDRASGSRRRASSRCCASE